LLVIFQALDTAGKDGSIRHVVSCMNPMGVQVTSFKKPSVEELKHDFLWRVYPHFPAKGMIQVFNRSHYEDILVPSVEKTLSEKKIAHLCELINRLEEHLERSDTHIIKFFLHVSNEEQNKRINE
jgi:polyphosphate kinase 2 (PPK2 family)